MKILDYFRCNSKFEVVNIKNPCNLKNSRNARGFAPTASKFANE